MKGSTQKMGRRSGPALGTIGNYVLVERLGNERDINVFLAHRRTSAASQGPSPLMVLKSASVMKGDGRGAEVLQCEAEVMIRFDHPCIVGYRDFFQAAGNAVLVLQYVGDMTLERFTRGVDAARWKVPEAVVWHMALAVFDALAYAHGAAGAGGAIGPIVHRNVSPSNVLLSDEGKVLLGGFSSAQGVDISDDITAHGAFVSVPSYLSPEQVGGAAPSTRSDAFAAALMVWELLTGLSATPAGLTDYDLLVQLAERSVEPLRAARPDLPALVTTAIDTCLNTDPHERRISCDEVAGCIRAAISEAELSEGRRALRDAIAMVRAQEASGRKFGPGPLRGSANIAARNKAASPSTCASRAERPDIPFGMRTSSVTKVSPMEVHGHVPSASAASSGVQRPDGRLVTRPLVTSQRPDRPVTADQNDNRIRDTLTQVVRPPRKAEQGQPTSDAGKPPTESERFYQPADGPGLHEYDDHDDVATVAVSLSDLGVSPSDLGIVQEDEPRVTRQPVRSALPEAVARGLETDAIRGESEPDFIEVLDEPRPGIPPSSGRERPAPAVCAPQTFGVAEESGSGIIRNPFAAPSELVVDIRMPSGQQSSYASTLPHGEGTTGGGTSMVDYGAQSQLEPDDPLSNSAFPVFGRKSNRPFIALVVLMGLGAVAFVLWVVWSWRGTGHSPSPSISATTIGAVARGESSKIAVHDSVAAVEPGRSGTSAEANDALADTQMPADATGVAVGATESLVTVTGPPEGLVYLSGKAVGRTGLAIRTACGRKFLRVGLPVEGRSATEVHWLVDGRTVNLVCGGMTRLSVSAFAPSSSGSAGH